jgi:hypothetical protein
MKWLFSICLFCLSFFAQGQIVIGSNTKIDSGPSSTLVTSLSITNQSAGTDLNKLKLVLASIAGQTFGSIGNKISTL